MDLSVRTETFLQEDQSWLGSAHGTSSGRSITLEAAQFTEADHFPDGYFLSGIPLAIVGGLARPYASGAADGSEVLAGFLFTAIKANPDGGDVNGVLLDHGRIIVANLPVAFTAPTTVANNAGQFVLV